MKDENPETETIPSPSKETEDQSESNVDNKEAESLGESTIDAGNEPETESQKQETEPEMEEPEPEVKEIEVSMSSLVVEENGKFSVSQSPRESVSSAASTLIDRSKKNDVNPDYRSPYALSDDQKKRLRKRERAKQRKLREDAEAERIQKQEIEVTSFFNRCVLFSMDNEMISDYERKNRKVSFCYKHDLDMIKSSNDWSRC